MNKYINKIFLTSAFAVVGLLGTTSCTDYLDKSPESDYQANDPYKNFMNFQGFTEELYNCIPVVSNSEYHTCFNYGEDVYWEPQEVRLQTRNVDNGDFWGWTTAYYGYPRSGVESLILMSYFLRMSIQLYLGFPGRNVQRSVYLILNMQQLYCRLIGMKQLLVKLLLERITCALIKLWHWPIRERRFFGLVVRL